MENLLTKTANQQDFSTELQKATDFYGDDLDTKSLSVQLSNLASHFTGSSAMIKLQDCLEYLRGLSDGVRFFAQKCARLLAFILCNVEIENIPA